MLLIPDVSSRKAADWTLQEGLSRCGSGSGPTVIARSTSRASSAELTLRVDSTSARRRQLRRRDHLDAAHANLAVAQAGPARARREAQCPRDRHHAPEAEADDPRGVGHLGRRTWIEVRAAPAGRAGPAPVNAGSAPAQTPASRLRTRALGREYCERHEPLADPAAPRQRTPRRAHCSASPSFPQAQPLERLPAHRAGAVDEAARAGVGPLGRQGDDRVGALGDGLGAAVPLRSVAV